MAKKKYTVVGLYDDNRQTCVWHIDANSIADCAARARVEMKGDGAIIAVFKGRQYDVYEGVQ